MQEMINRIGERMVIKARVVNIMLSEGAYKHNVRECPFYSEFYGMIEILKTLDLPLDIEYDADVVNMTALTINGTRFEI